MRNRLKYGLPILSIILLIVIVPNVYATDSRAVIVSQISSHLNNTAISSQVQLENIRQAEHLVFAKAIILETNGVAPTVGISDNYDAMMVTLKIALLDCTETQCLDENVAAQAKELYDRITIWQEFKEQLEVETSNASCDATDPNTCVHLRDSEEPLVNGTIMTESVALDNIWNGFYRDIRSPFLPVIPGGDGLTPSQRSLMTEPIENGQCVTLLDETQGIKAVVRPVILTIWQEPLQEIGIILLFDTVWTVDFIPADFVEIMTLCNEHGVVNFDYSTKLITQRELLHFWKYLPSE